MKRFLSLTLSIIIVLSLVACGDKTATDNNSQVEQNNTTSDTIIDSNQTGNETNNIPPIVSNNENATSTDDGHTHTYKKVVVSPTCEKDGFTSYSCDCGAQYTEDTKMATGHKYSEWKEKKAPTENAVGKEERKCKNCEKIESRDIPKLIKGHTHSYTSSITKEATCQSEGIKTFSCTCGAKYTETIGKTNHNYKTETINPTCTSAGYTKYTCDCGKSYYDNMTNATSHKYTDKVVAPTCTTAGYTTHTCKVCGNTYTDSNKSATGHSWGSWVTVTAATVGKAGQEKRTCSTCKTTETKTIPALEDNSPTETITIQFPQTPLSVNTINYNANTGKYGVSHTIRLDNIYYKIDSLGYLNLYCSGEKTYDIKGADSTHSCEMKWRLYDSEGYLISSGWDFVGSLKVGDKFKDHKINVSLISITPGTSYRLEIFDSSYE